MSSNGAGLTDREVVRLVLGCAARFELRELALTDPRELMELEALTPGAAARLVGALELVRRLSTRSYTAPRMTTATAIWEWIRPLLPGLRRETFRVLCLTPRSTLLKEVVVAEGSVDSCHVDPREVFAPAVSCRASSIVLVHNHPSGDPEPSTQDIQLTQQLRTAGEALCIRVIDHVVVTETGFVSMMQRRLLEASDRLQ